MSAGTTNLVPGRIARVRQRTYLIEEVVKPPRAADSTLVRLSCVDDDNQGQPLEVLWEKELDPQILTSEAWEAIASKGFDETPVFASYLNTLKWNCVTATDPKLFQSPFRAGIRLDTYQLEPLRKALRLPRVNLFIADDAAREGLNLQAHCWNLFHFDVPWNPSRMEQRNGRIDRKLQPQDAVRCHYFYYRQRAEDRILDALVRKTETIRKELGSLAQVIDARLTDQLKQGIRHDQVDDLARDIDGAQLDPARRAVVDEELEANRQRHTELKQQIDRLRTALEESQAQIGLRQEPFQSAISCALHLAGGAPLAPLAPAERPNDCQQTQCLTFPPLDQQKSDWTATLDALRAPRPRGQKLWEWRNSSPIRPIVFHDPGVVTDQVVHLHLEHRVVQRLLGRFIAQGFVYHDLSRACLTQSRDAIPRVILLGRLALYGPSAARLHEEIIPITARWTDPDLRNGPLAPYARDSETKTLQLLEDSLLGGGGRALTASIRQQLQAAAGRDIQELLPHLQTRGEEYAADAAKKLRERAKAESHAMRDILVTQKKHIEATVAKYEKTDRQQQRLDFGELANELRQLEDNHRYWVKRLTSLDDVS